MADLNLYNWPDELPQDVFTDSGPTHAPQNNIISSAVTSGPAKKRRRFTAFTTPVTFTVELCETQYAILEDFVINKLGEVNQFNWKNFKTGEPAVYRFPDGWSSVKDQWFAGDIWTVSVELERMP